MIESAHSRSPLRRSPPRRPAPKRARSKPDRSQRHPAAPSPDPNEFDITRHIDRGLATVIDQSVTDATEILWLDRKKQRIAANLDDVGAGLWRERTVEVRVHQGQRFGQHRLGMASWNELANAIRLATANATAAEGGPSAFQTQPPHLDSPLGFDRKVSRLCADDAKHLLDQLCTPDEAAVIVWNDGQVLLRNSAGLALSQRVTSLQVEVRSGIGPGAGFASDAARRLQDLDLEALFRLARSRRAPASPESEATSSASLVLAPEATAELVELLNQRAFRSCAYREGTSFLRDHLGVQVFDSRLNLRDDGLDPGGLPFPFDLEGRPKQRTLLVEKGVPRTPTLDIATAQTCGLSPTSNGVSSGVGYGLNLFMEPGDASESEVLDAGDGGIWISRLDAVECFDPSRMMIRARARGARQIRNGHLTHPLPDLVWEDSLLRIFASLGGLGRTTARRLSSDGVLGGICAPTVLVQSPASLRPAF